MSWIPRPASFTHGAVGVGIGAAVGYGAAALYSSVGSTKTSPVATQPTAKSGQAQAGQQSGQQSSELTRVWSEMNRANHYVYEKCDSRELVEVLAKLCVHLPSVKDTTQRQRILDSLDGMMSNVHAFFSVYFELYKTQGPLLDYLSSMTASFHRTEEFLDDGITYATIEGHVVIEGATIEYMKRIVLRSMHGYLEDVANASALDMKRNP